MRSLLSVSVDTERDELMRYLTSAEFRARPLSYALLSYMADGVTGPSDVLMQESGRVDRIGTNAAGAGTLCALTAPLLLGCGALARRPICAGRRKRLKCHIHCACLCLVRACCSEVGQ